MTNSFVIGSTLFLVFMSLVSYGGTARDRFDLPKLNELTGVKNPSSSNPNAGVTSAINQAAMAELMNRINEKEAEVAMTERAKAREFNKRQKELDKKSQQLAEEKKKAVDLQNKLVNSSNSDLEKLPDSSKVYLSEVTSSKDITSKLKTTTEALRDLNQAITTVKKDVSGDIDGNLLTATAEKLQQKKIKHVPLHLKQKLTETNQQIRSAVDMVNIGIAGGRVIKQ